MYSVKTQITLSYDAWRFLLPIPIKVITLQLPLKIHYDSTFNLALNVSSQQFSTFIADNIKTQAASYTVLTVDQDSHSIRF